ncbi:MAG: ligand-binding sensor domain-containing protein [Prevotella sp.]|jgi:ligand-binding sensor domain-containing protein/AraC-like DNA-binding protein
MPRIFAKLYHGIVVLLLTNFLPVAVHGQTIRALHVLSKEDGLESRFVTDIMADRNGRIWMTTSKGVCTYNGVRVLNYPLPSDNGTLNNAYEICENEDGTKFVCSKQGLFEMKVTDNAFHRIYPEIGKAEHVYAHGGKIYVNSPKGIWVCADGKARLYTTGSSIKGLAISVRDIIGDGKGGVWFLTRYNLNHLDARGKITAYQLARQMPEKSALSELALINGKFYIGTTNNGLYTYSLKDHIVRSFPGVGNNIHKMKSLSGGLLCVATDGSGAYLIDTRSDRVVQRFDNEESTPTLPTNVVNCYYRDRLGVDWFGVSFFGLAYVYYTAPLFKTYRMGAFNTAGMNVTCICLNGQQKVLGTNDGVYLIDEQTRQVVHFDSEQLLGVHTINFIAYYDGAYYIGSRDAGVRRFDPVTHRVEKLLQNPLLSYVKVFSMTVSPDQHLWIGTNEGVFVLDREGGIRQYTEFNARLFGGPVQGIVFNSSNSAWLAGSKGIAVYQNGVFENANFPNKFFNRQSFNKAVIGKNGDVYFMSDAKLYFTRPDLSRFGIVELPKGLADEKLLTFCDDFRGCFWITSDNGLFRLSYDLKTLQHFGQGEGLEGQVNGCNVVAEAGGRIWVGTTEGLMYMDMSALENYLAHAPARVLLYNVRRGGNLISNDEEIALNNTRTLPVKWNVVSQKLTVRPLMADFAIPNNRYYEYRMDGEKKWTLVPDAEEISIRHLFLGRHRLEVRLAGVPSTLQVYTIKVMPSWMAVVEVLLLVIALLLLWRWQQYRKQTDLLRSERDEMEQALIESGDELRNKDEKEEQELAVTTQQKYQRVKIDEQECASIVQRMNDYVEKKKPYIDPNLKMSDLADYLHLSPSKLSQVFSLYLKESYYDYINKYRLEAFKQLVARGEGHRYTITALSEKCGFKRSNFFATFRKMEGMTPTEYLKQAGEA